jgi:hypothetical protein
MDAWQHRTYAGTEDPQFTVTMTPPEDVTGWAIAYTVYTADYGVADSGSLGDGVTVTDATLGVLVVETARLRPGVYYVLVERTSPGFRTLARVLLEVNPPPA